MKPLLPRWLRGGEELDVEAVRRRLDRQFLYRGSSTLELRVLRFEAGCAHVAFYARPIFPGDRRMQHRTREAAFAEQLFQDTVTVLQAVALAAGQVQAVELSAWAKTVDGVGREIALLRMRATLESLTLILRRGRLSAWDLLRALGTRSCIDRHGNFHAEKEL